MRPERSASALGSAVSTAAGKEHPRKARHTEGAANEFADPSKPKKEK